MRRGPFEHFNSTIASSCEFRHAAETGPAAPGAARACLPNVIQSAVGAYCEYFETTVWVADNGEFRDASSETLPPTPSSASLSDMIQSLVRTYREHFENAVQILRNRNICYAAT